MSAPNTRYGLTGRTSALAVFESRGGNGSLFINDTAPHVGDFTNVTALTAAVANLTAGNMSGPATAVNIPAGVTVYGNFTSITLASGSVQAFNS